MSLLEIVRYTRDERYEIKLKTKKKLQLKKYIKEISSLLKTKPENLRFLYQNKVLGDLSKYLELEPMRRLRMYRHSNDLRKGEISIYVALGTSAKSFQNFNFVIIKEGMVFDRMSMADENGLTTIDDVRKWLSHEVKLDYDVFSLYFDNFGRTTELLRNEPNEGRHDTMSKLLSTPMNSFLCSNSSIPVFLRSLGWKSGTKDLVTVTVKAVVPSKIVDPLSITIATLTGKKLLIKAYSDSLVEEIKELIRDEEGIPLDQQRLVFLGVQLEEGRTVRSYDIKNESILHLVLRLRGGGGISFVDVTKGFAKETGWSNSAPEWRTVGSGLVIEGVCRNRSCVAYKQNVCCTLGFENFDLIQEAHKVKCPMCKKNFKPVEPGFSNCFWRISALKEGESEVFSTPWKQTGDVYCSYDKHTSGEARFQRLQIFVNRLNSNQLEYTAPIPHSCAICSEDIMDGYNYFYQGNVVQLQCQHTFHKNCVLEGTKEGNESDVGSPLKACVLCDAIINLDYYPSLLPKKVL